MSAEMDMEGRIVCADGAEYRLPTLLSWDISHGFCSPCDCFEVSFLYRRNFLETLQAACRFRAVFNGQTVFFGVVDELELTADAGGCTAVLRGRGLQALLLDSEAESADYFGADTEFILAHHVRPLGVTEIETGGAAGRTAALSVDSGESHWAVVKRFAEFCLGLSPRFTPDGRLLLDGADSGRCFTVDGRTPMSAQRFVLDRYGVIGTAIVKNRVLGTRTEVENPELLALGGQCIRVINVPRKTGFDAMRHTGAYQIRESEKDFLRCRLTAAECFAAFPGDRAELKETPLGVTGQFRVYATRCFADGKNAGTVIDLRRIKEGTENNVDI